MAENRGKQFENVIRDAFKSVPDTLVVRLHDQTTGFIGSVNPCDFIVYHYPLVYTLECKSIHGNTLPLANITDNQWKKLTEMSNIPGVVSGVICWWVEQGETLFIPIETLQRIKDRNGKSIRFDAYTTTDRSYRIPSRQRRVFCDYDMSQFFHVMEENYEWERKQKAKSQTSDEE